MTLHHQLSLHIMKRHMTTQLMDDITFTNKSMNSSSRKPYHDGSSANQSIILASTKAVHCTEVSLTYPFMFPPTKCLKFDFASCSKVLIIMISRRQ